MNNCENLNFHLSTSSLREASARSFVVNGFGHGVLLFYICVRGRLPNGDFRVGTVLVDGPPFVLLDTL